MKQFRQWWADMLGNANTRLHSHVKNRGIAVLTAIALAATLAACSSTSSSATAIQISDTSSSSSATYLISAKTQNESDYEGKPATDVLAKLKTKGRAPKTDYSRKQFGTAWADVDHNGCDTRNDILNRDLTDTTHKSGTHDCIVTTGKLADPYTGKTINFKRGNKTSRAVQIDHVVALSDAWQKGAQQLSKDKRKELANDPYNLLAVDGPANQKKSDGDAATWLPKNKSFRCEYVARQIGVKAKYSLWVTKAERKAMTTVLKKCPAQKVPLSDESQATADAAEAKRQAQAAEEQRKQEAAQQQAAEAQRQAEQQAQQQQQQQAQQQNANVYYQNCTAVRAAGKAPLYQGQPGYSTKLDRDRDGVACE